LKIFFPDLFIDTIYEIDVDTLKKRGIKGLIIDIDNTLTAHNKPEADKTLIEWIEQVKSQGLRICLVSNNSEGRVMIFNKALNLDAIYRANKPSKKPFIKAMGYLGTKPQETAVIGDQIFTDIWGGNRLNMFTILVIPISQKEFFFIKFKRLVEKFIMYRYSRRKSEDGKPRDGSSAS
jgi:HAD superfamily phosphatase (TIGR01668 family)